MGMSRITDKSLKSVEHIINRLISDDKDALLRMARLSGKCIELCIVNKSIRIYIWPSSSGVKLDTTSEDRVDVTIKGSTSDMLSYVLAAKESTSSQKRNLEVIGDIGLAQEFQNIMKSIDIDWEEYLSAYTGDVLAHTLGNIFKAGAEYTAYASNKMREDISEYLMYEKRVLLSDIEVNEFISKIDVLRDDVERLKIRIDRL